MSLTDPSPPLHRLLSQAADAVAAVRAGRSLTDTLARCPAELRAGTQALAFATLRRLGSVLALRALMAPKAPPAAVEALLLVALALLLPEAGAPADAGAAPYPDHTLVDQAVVAVRQRAPAAAGFVNAVLRRLLRERTALLAQVQQQPEAAYEHPLWWIERVRRDWPTRWQALLAAANQHPPMTLRVNTRRLSVDACRHKLAAAGHAAQPLGGAGLRLARPCPVQQLPGFADGELSVQDASAQRAAPLLLHGDGSLPPLPAGARVLDACAAPGGKTAHLLELAELDLLALDSDAQRLQRVQQTLDRLRLGADGLSRVQLRAADAGQPASWWDGRPFDAILLDAPCTASGIVRRHPDVRWLRRSDDVAALVHTQARLLDALWPLLKPGGRLLYATCSWFRDEGERQIDAFLQRWGPASVRRSGAAPGHLLPLPDNPASASALGATPADAAAAAGDGDGFYYALLTVP